MILKPRLIASLGMVALVSAAVAGIRIALGARRARMAPGRVSSGI